MTIFGNLDNDVIGDDYCGLYKIHDKNKYAIVADNKVPMSKLKMPNIGEKFIVSRKVSKSKVSKYLGEVIDKYGDDHILVKNLKNGLRESLFKREILTREVTLKTI